MMVKWEGPHPDVGSIHAWLDGALDASEAAKVEEHARECAECASRVAEARGLIAGASRVAGLLDEIPTALIRPATTPTAAGGNSMWRVLRVTPARASIAAVLLVALGISLTRTRVATESVNSAESSSASRLSKEGVVASAPSPNSAPMKDGLLDSAIARRLANDHPVRTLEATPGMSVPAPSPSELASAAAPDASAPTRVAAAKASIRAQLDSAGPPADRARVGFNAAAPATAQRMAVAGRAAEGAAAQDAVSGRVGGVAVSQPVAGQCYLVESNKAGAQWGSVVLPLIVAFDPSGPVARVLTADGGETDTRATLRQTAPDSLVLLLRRIGYDGSLALSGMGAARNGVMRSSQSSLQLSEVATTGVSAGAAKTADASPNKPRSDSTRSIRAAASSAPLASQREMKAVGGAAAAVAVSARLVVCPKP